MNIFNKYSIATISVVSLALGLMGPVTALAATTPTLGAASTFGILSSTYTNTAVGTTINGDLGYITGPAVMPTVNGTDYASTTPTYINAGIAQTAALAALDAQPCTFTFATGAINLATDTTHGALGVYTPGVYCTGASSAASIGTAGITLSGPGTYIFRVHGALTTVANSNVITQDGASSCDVFWTPDAATTLGANTTFKGTLIDASGITIGDTVTWLGRALAYGGTVSTVRDTITTACGVASSAPPGLGTRDGFINVVKLVINDSGGTKTVADFPLFVNGIPVVSGVTKNFPAPALVYTVTETGDANYVKTFSGSCDVNGQLNLNPGSSSFCVVTNDDIGPPALLPPPLIDVVKVPSPLALPNGPGPVTYNYTLHNIGIVPVSNVTMVGDTCSPINLISGDLNGDSKLDVNETWVYTCSTTLSQTHTNIVTATGQANGITAIDTASATVVVGLPVVPPLIHIVKRPSVFVLANGGGAVTYNYTVTNPGTAPLSNVSVIDDKCTGLPGRVVGHPGDLNQNNLLESNEVWSFTCKTNLTQTTTNTGMAQGSANGLIAIDFAPATVIVAPPKLPNTGFGPDGKNTPWNILMLAGIVMLVSVSTLVVLRKRAI